MAVRLDIALPTEVSIALRRFANMEGLDLDRAAVFALREWLTGMGYLEAPDLDEDTPVEGNA